MSCEQSAVSHQLSAERNRGRHDRQEMLLTSAGNKVFCGRVDEF